MSRNEFNHIIVEQNYQIGNFYYFCKVINFNESYR